MMKYQMIQLLLETHIVIINLLKIVILNLLVCIIVLTIVNHAEILMNY